MLVQWLNHSKKTSKSKGDTERHSRMRAPLLFLPLRCLSVDFQYSKSSYMATCLPITSPLPSSLSLRVASTYLLKFRPSFTSYPQLPPRSPSLAMCAFTTHSDGLVHLPQYIWPVLWLLQRSYLKKPQCSPEKNLQVKAVLLPNLQLKRWPSFLLPLFQTVFPLPLLHLRASWYPIT